MLYRTLPLCLLALVFALFVGAVAVAKDKDAKDAKADTPTEGTVVSVDKGKITYTDKDKKEQTSVVADDAKNSCDGKDCKLADLKKDVKVKLTITGKDKDAKVTKIEASTK